MREASRRTLELRSFAHHDENHQAVRSAQHLRCFAVDRPSRHCLSRLRSGMTLTPDLLTHSAVFGALLLNLVAMLFARPVLKYAGMPMQIMGSVVGIIQVALGLKMIVSGLRGLEILPRP
jgi:hypothetical protein